MYDNLRLQLHREEEQRMQKRSREESKVELNVLKDKVIEVANRFEVLQFDLATGRFTLSLKNKSDISIRNAFARIILTDGEKLQTSDNWTSRTWDKTNGSEERGKVSFTVVHSGTVDEKSGNSSLKLSFQAFADTPSILLRLEFTNNTGKSVRIKEFQPLVVDSAEDGSFNLGSSTKNWRFLKNGYQTSSPCYSLSLSELDKTCSVEFFRNNFNPRSKFNAVKDEFDSEWMLAFKDNATGNSAVIGFVTMNNNMSQVDFRVDPQQKKIQGLWARSISDDTTCKNGETISSEKLFTDMVGPISDELDRYADRTALEMNAVPWKKVPTGWCSWYEFFEKISEELILNVIEYYRKNREKYPIEYIQIDDGYFIHRGDWTTPTSMFPHGMKFIADRIKEAGFKPGIWLSPFQISGGSNVFKEHPDWTIRDEKGKPVGHDFDTSMKYSYYGLDCTNPAVIEWLKYIFKTITQDWGYEYVKIDFLFAATFDGLRYDKNATRAQALRRGLEAIREAVGERVMVLGCLAPLGQAVGLVNSYRVSPDTATRWKPPWQFDCGPALRDTMRNTILRYFMHNKFWLNDPDCVIARRGKDRSEFPKAAEIEYLAQGGTITDDEVKFEMTVLGLLGGPIIYSDDPLHLPPEREKYLPLLLPAHQGKARVVDLLEEVLPKILNLKIHRAYGNWDLVGLLNWDDSPKDIELEFSRLELKSNQFYHVFSFWDEKYLGRIKDKVTIKGMPAHSASLLSIREVGSAPQLLSSNIHVTQGGPEIVGVIWRTSDKRLDIALSHPGKRTGKLFIYVPPPYKYNSITSENAELSTGKTTGDNTIMEVELSFRQSAKVSIKFS
jgi:alpha-galactosidase